MKPGIKTTEFWVALAAQAMSALMLFGVITPDQSSALNEAVIQIAGVVGMVGSAFGYAIARGMAKKSE